ncbi:MAG: hypothetical protein ACR2KQ_09880 [Actinomycetota bacterium]
MPVLVIPGWIGVAVVNVDMGGPDLDQVAAAGAPVQFPSDVEGEMQAIPFESLALDTSSPVR